MIDLDTLWNAMPRDVQRKISCHDLKRIVDNLNPPGVIRVCGVDCHPGGEYCNGYCEGKADEPALLPAISEDKESEMMRWLEDKMKQVRVNVAARDLVKLVEGTTDEYRRNGARLKDSEEWAKFFVAVRRLDSENAKMEQPRPQKDHE